MRDSFHNESFGPWKAGDVVRLFDGPFGDGAILGFADNGNVKVSRPYAYASCVGTTGPTALLGAEIIIYNQTELARYVKVGGDRVTR